MHGVNSETEQRNKLERQCSNWCSFTRTSCCQLATTMSLSLDDKLLGEKTEYYCSSSEDERDDDDGDEINENASSGNRQAPSIPRPELKDYDGSCTNTGPKGVINDWREFKKLENEKREEQEREKDALIKKLSVTCRSHLDDEREKTERRAVLTGTAGT
ncbi:hypothetical protein ScPMuIL_009807 [Solemya velum]